MRGRRPSRRPPGAAEARLGRSSDTHGRISLFPGVTQAHAILVMEIAVRIHAQLRGTPCRIFVSDVLTEWRAVILTLS